MTDPAERQVTKSTMGVEPKRKVFASSGGDITKKTSRIR